MRAVLLAAGRSKRLWPLSDKNFLTFLGKPLIEHQISTLHRAGISDVIVVGGAHNLDRLQNLTLKFPGIRYVEQKDLDQGQAGGVLAASQEIGDEPFLLISCNDVVEQSAFESILERAKESDASSLLLAKRVESYFPGGYLEVDKGNMLKRIVEKPGKGNEPSDMVNLVIHIHKNPKLLFQKLQSISGQTDGIYEQALDSLVSQGFKIEVVPYQGFWQAIKYPWHIVPVAHFFFDKSQKRISARAKIAKTAVIKGEVIIEDDVSIFDYAVISGPCYIGKGVTIANHALVRDSYIEEGSVVGFKAEVARSYLGKNVWTHNNYIGDSIISDECAFGSGTVTGNLRLDQQEIFVQIQTDKISTGRNKFGLVTGCGVRAGINTSFMPGVKIGASSFIGAGIVIAQDIPENRFVKGKWELDMRENKTH